MSELIQKLFTIHDSLTEAGMAHAFGGSVALAYCTEEPMATRGFAIYLGVGSNRAEEALNGLPDQIPSAPKGAIETLTRDGQIRLHWDDIPVEVFLSTSPVHEWATGRIVWVPLEGREVPVLDCASLVIFKAFFDRTQDWADLEAVARATPEDIEAAAEAIAELVGEEDPAVRRLASLLPG